MTTLSPVSAADDMPLPILLASRRIADGKVASYFPFAETTLPFCPLLWLPLSRLKYDQLFRWSMTAENFRMDAEGMPSCRQRRSRRLEISRSCVRRRGTH